jgi:hypothetical protein
MLGLHYDKRKIHYNVMHFRKTLAVDEAEALAGRFKSVRVDGALKKNLQLKTFLALLLLISFVQEIENIF